MDFGRPGSGTSWSASPSSSPHRSDSRGSPDSRVRAGGVDIVVVAELQERVSPNLFSLAVALGAGVAGILSLTRGFSEAIVGVMIAAALIPPAAAVGITTAWGCGVRLSARSSSSSSTSCRSTSPRWSRSGWPATDRRLFEVSPTRRQTATYLAVFAVALLVLAAPLGAITLIEFQTTQVASAADEEVEAVLAEPRYDHLRPNPSRWSSTTTTRSGRSTASS